MENKFYFIFFQYSRYIYKLHLPFPSLYMGIDIFVSIETLKQYKELIFGIK